ncbi:MAG TPA: tetratricopeptide repeat protein [Bryobacteraceae bacterium]|nr:tetratricopeptide repeat protein [Bryobacteraceae bacterium]
MQKTAILVILLASLWACASKQSYLEKGNQYFDQGKYEDAALNYRKAIQKDSRYGEAYYRLGLTAIKQGFAGQAYSALLRADELLPDDPKVEVSLGDVALALYLKEPTQALHTRITQLADSLLAKDPNSFEGLQWKGYLASSDQKPSEAIAYFRKALQSNPSEPSLITALVQILFRQDQSKEGEKMALDLIARQKNYGPIYDALYHFYAGAKRLGDAEKILRLKVSNNPDKSDYILELALFYSALGKPKDVDATLLQLSHDPQRFPNGKLQVGDFYNNIQHFQQAADAYRQVLQGKPEDPLQVRKKLTNALLQLGQTQEATQTLDQILKASPGDNEALRLQATLWLDSGNPAERDRALTQLKALSVRNPEDPSVWFELGRAYAQKGNRDEARAQFLKAMQMRGDFLEPRYELAQLALSERRPNDALNQASQILAIQPGDLRGQLLHATAEAASGNTADAHKELTQLIKDSPGDADAQVELGRLALSQKKFQEASAIFSKLRQTGDPRATVGLARTLSAQNQFDKAIEMLNAALQKSPDSPLFLEETARISALAGNYDTAVADYRKLITAAPGSSQERLSLGEVYEFKGDYKNAIDAYRQALELAPDDPVPALALAGVLAKNGQIKEAQVEYETVIRAHPDNAVALNNLASLLSESGGDLDEALRLAKRALEKVPGQPSFYDTVGYIYLKKGMRDSALQTFGSLVQKYPGFSTFHYHLGIALLQKGDKAAARRELEAALADHPSREEAAKIKEAVSKI